MKMHTGLSEPGLLFALTHLEKSFHVQIDWEIQNPFVFAKLCKWIFHTACAMHGATSNEKLIKFTNKLLSKLLAKFEENAIRELFLGCIRLFIVGGALLIHLR